MPRKGTHENEAEIYREAATDHITLARELHEAGRYVMSHYLAGLAVECIFRAYLYRLSPIFSGRHDLQVLYRDARFDDGLTLENKAEVGAALTEVSRRWSNSHRYRSEDALRLFLRRANIGRKGKFVRESSRRITNAATVIVELGVLRWND